MNITIRTLEKEEDIPQIINVHEKANISNGICSWMSVDFWKWKYHVGRPFYDPRGYQVAEYNNKLVSSINCTLREMNFGGKTYKAAGIDDVSTIPSFMRKGLSQKLLTNAIKFMEEKNVDLSILVADPSYHAHEFYHKNGYDYSTEHKFAIKIINPMKVIYGLPLSIPLISPLHLLSKAKERLQAPKCKLPLEIKIIKDNDEEFLDCLNKNYSKLLSFEKFSKNYWNWFRIEKPPLFENIIVCAKLNGKIIGGGTLTKAYYHISLLPKRLNFYVLSELFVDEEYRRQGVASKICKALEYIASKKGVGMFFVNYNVLHYPVENFLRKNGYFVVPMSDYQMIKPISNRYKKIHEKVKKAKVPWHIALEQSGF